jgi:hypothetical protein
MEILHDIPDSGFHHSYDSECSPRYTAVSICPAPQDRARFCESMVSTRAVVCRASSACKDVIAKVAIEVHVEKQSHRQNVKEIVKRAAAEHGLHGLFVIPEHI